MSFLGRIKRWYCGTPQVTSERDKKVDKAILDLQASTASISARVRKIEDLAFKRNPFTYFADRINPQNEHAGNHEG